VELVSYREKIDFFDAAGNPLTSWVEVRVDPLTGEVSRVINVPLRDWSLPDLEAMARETRGNCPFCPEHLGKKTPKFPPSLFPEGELRHGGVVVIPNRFPYDRYCALIILSERHYVPLEEWTAEEIFDGLHVAQAFIDRVVEVDETVHAFSLNWNYAPHSGSSILHPHIQLSVGAFANNRARRLITTCYREMLKGRDPMAELIAEEQARGERWCGTAGPWHILFAFAPRGRFFELNLIHESTGRFTELEAGELHLLAREIARSLRFVTHAGFSSMNLALFSPLREGDLFHPMISISPRACVGPYQMSDISFQMLIDEFFSLFLPEEVAGRFRGEWEGPSNLE